MSVCRRFGGGLRLLMALEGRGGGDLFWWGVLCGGGSRGGFVEVVGFGLASWPGGDVVVFLDGVGAAGGGAVAAGLGAAEFLECGGWAVGLGGDVGDVAAFVEQESAPGAVHRELAGRVGGDGAVAGE